MFFHPKTKAYIIGSFNDTEYKSEALRFMLSKVINRLLKCEECCGRPDRAVSNKGCGGSPSRL